ncbi:MAG TPA: hypothetical protein VGG72_06365 [Bryobacteraceae bacterium]|jgi:hypothetical protein
MGSSACSPRTILRQTALATALFAAHQVWIAKTVLVEVAWVLAVFYKYRFEAVHEALEKLAGLPNVRVEDEPAVVSALALSAQASVSPMHCTSRAGRMAPGLRPSTKPSFAWPEKAGAAEAMILDSTTSS